MLDPAVRRALELEESLPPEETVAGKRARYERLAPLLSGPGEAIASVRDADADGVPVRVYEPAGAQGTLLFCHGGGWVVGSLDSHDALCRALALRSGAAVVSVGYRLAPEHPFPAPLDDADRALRWTAAVRPGPLAVGGDSAGGTLAAVLARRSSVAIALQLLAYPPLDAAARDGADPACGFTREDMDRYWSAYAGAAAGDPDASPAAAADLGGQAPALVVLADCDPLRAEAERYAARLDHASVHVVPGTAHGFLRWGAVAPDAARAGLDACADALRSALRGR